jgi:hypothetical protein
VQQRFNGTAGAPMRGMTRSAAACGHAQIYCPIIGLVKSVRLRHEGQGGRLARAAGWHGSAPDAGHPEAHVLEICQPYRVGAAASHSSAGTQRPYANVQPLERIER